MDLRILHVDPHLLIVDKPAGLLSVPGRLPEHRDCALARVQQAHPGALAVHRLDQVTSGLLVFARDVHSHRALSEAFAQRRVGKTYVALVHGMVAGDAGRIDLPLAPDWPRRPRQVVDHAVGKPSVTEWMSAARDEVRQRTRLVLCPQTGRTHQLRVHLAAIGHPIVGDVFYGASPATRVMLHATRLAFDHPAGLQAVDIRSPAPF